MEERRPDRDYYLELKDIRDRLTWTVAKVGGLDQEEKPEELVEDFELGELIHTLDYAIELADNALGRAQMLLAVAGQDVRDRGREKHLESISSFTRSSRACEV
jgi:hypothetical protein